MVSNTVNTNLNNMIYIRCSNVTCYTDKFATQFCVIRRVFLTQAL